MSRLPEHLRIHQRRKPWLSGKRIRLQRRSLLARYAVAALAVLAAWVGTSLMLGLNRIYSSRFLFFVAAVVVAAWYGGLRAGLLATAISVLVIKLFFLPPPNMVFNFNDETILLTVFVVVAVLISWFEERRKQGNIERVRLYEAEQQARQAAELSADRIERLYKITTALSGAITIPEVAKIVIDEGREMLNAGTGSFHLLVENGAAFEMVYVAGGRVPEEQSRWQRYPADPALPVTEVVRTGQPLWIETVQEWKARYPQLADYAEVYQGAAAGLPLLVKGQAVGAVGFIFPHERTFSQEDRDFMLAVSYQCAQALERARLYEAERQALELLQARVRLQSLISDLGRQALIAGDLPALMERTASLLGQTLDAEFIKILELYPEENNLLLKAGVGWKEGLVGQARVSASADSQAGYTLLSNGPVIVEDLHTETRFTGPPLLVEHGVISGMSVIIQGFERPWGVLGIHTARQRAFTQDDVYFLQSVANIIGAAIERARLQERMREAAVVEERHRLARDLHDAVSQALFSASVLTETLPKLMERQPTKVPGVLRQVHQLVKGASSELRILLYELRPETLVRNNIAELIGQLVDAAQAKRNLTISFQAEGDHALSQEVKVALFRITQESLTNILKHSEATEVSISLGCLPERIELRIRDNGRGFDPQQLSSGMGLVGMRERAQQIGARLNVTSLPGDGTEVVFALESLEASGAAAGSSAT